MTLHSAKVATFDTCRYSSLYLKNSNLQNNFVQDWHHITLEAEIERAMLLALNIKGMILDKTSKNNQSIQMHGRKKRGGKEEMRLIWGMKMAGGVLWSLLITVKL